MYVVNASVESLTGMATVTKRGVSCAPLTCYVCLCLVVCACVCFTTYQYPDARAFR